MVVFHEVFDVHSRLLLKTSTSGLGGVLGGSLAPGSIAMAVSVESTEKLVGLKKTN
jgi:hypothetical protein